MSEERPEWVPSWVEDGRMLEWYLGTNEAELAKALWEFKKAFKESWQYKFMYKLLVKMADLVIKISDRKHKWKDPFFDA